VSKHSFIKNKKQKKKENKHKKEKKKKFFYELIRRWSIKQI